MNRNLLSFSLFAALLPAIAAQDKVDLKIAAKKGDSCAFTAKSNQKQSVDLGGQQMDMTQQITQDLVVRVTDTAADGSLVVAVEIQRIRGSFDNPMSGSLEFDTAPPADAKKPADAKGGGDDDDDGGGMGMPSAGTLRRTMSELCKTFTAKVTAYGKVTEVTGIDEALKAARNKAGFAAMMLSGMLNEGAVKQLISAAFGPLPKEPVAVGGGWDADPLENKGGGGVSTSRQLTMKLAKADADTAEITVSGTISQLKDGDKKEGDKKDAKDADESESAAQARQTMADAKIEHGKIAGTVTVSRKDGFVLGSETKMSMDITAPNPMSGDDMQVAVTSVMTVERAKPAAAADKPATTGGK